jgi:hypothetical protein
MLHPRCAAKIVLAQNSLAPSNRDLSSLAPSGRNPTVHAAIIAPRTANNPETNRVRTMQNGSVNRSALRRRPVRRPALMLEALPKMCRPSSESPPAR